MLPCVGSPSMVAARAAGRWWAELTGSERTDCRGLRNTMVSSRFAESPARVNSPHCTPRAAFAHPEELPKYLTPFMKGGKNKNKSKRLKAPAENSLAQNPTVLRGPETEAADS